MSSGAQTIRDVLIRIGIQADNRGIQNLDLRGMTQEAKEATRAFDDLARSKQRAASAGGGAGGGGRGGGGRGGSGFKAKDGNADGVFGPFVSGRNSVQDVIFQEEQLVLKRGDLAAKDQQRRAVIDRQNLERQSKLLEVENQRADALNGLAMGTMKLGRGYAFLTAATNEEYQATLKLIAQAQGYFDVVSGGIDILKNLNNMRKAATAATLAQAAAEGTLAAAQSASGATSLLSIGRMPALRGLGALARYAAPATVAAAGAYVVGGLARSEYNTFTSGSRYWEKYDSDLAKRMSDRNNMREQIVADSMSRIDENTSRISGRRDSSEAMRAEMLRTRRITSSQAIGQIDEEAANAIGLLRHGGEWGDSRTSGIEKTQRQMTAADIGLKAEKEKLAILEQAEGVMRRQFDVAQGILRTTTETLHAEQDRYTSMEERFGRLDPAQQARIRGIAEKRSRGETLTRADIEALDASGTYGSRDVSNFFRQSAQAAGSTAIASAFGDDAGLNQARQAASSAARLAAQSNEEVTAALTAIATQRKAADDKVLEILGAIRELTDQHQQDLDRMRLDAEEAARGRLKSSGEGSYWFWG